MSLIETARCETHVSDGVQRVDVHEEAIEERAGMYGTREVVVTVRTLVDCGCDIDVRETGEVIFS